MNRNTIKRILITVGVTAGFLAATASQAGAGGSPGRRDLGGSTV